ncbi:hypothetical protein BACERE00183_04098 [Bacillus cereus]|uniref:hypothetical protein n=1 Tax=Bacillus cereus TaxID=1396 RepID=UPI000A3020FA|nr:hypothetical protein [Bacillus cereus]PES55198.1 hypothetical protein CN515_03855 [Bacillus cereus]SME48392.1 hypothetical protein BACERE00183_04098 [Bacillus cereus]
MGLDNLFVVTKEWAENNNCLKEDGALDFEIVAKTLNTNEFIIDMDSFRIKRPLTPEEVRGIIQEAIDYFSKTNDETKVEKPSEFKIHYLSNGKIL